MSATLFDSDDRHPLPDGSVAVVADRGGHILLSREVDGAVVWGQAFMLSPYDEYSRPDKDAPARKLAALLAAMAADPGAFTREAA